MSIEFGEYPESRPNLKFTKLRNFYMRLIETHRFRWSWTFMGIPNRWIHSFTETRQKNKTFHLKTQRFSLSFAPRESSKFHISNLHSASEKKKRTQPESFWVKCSQKLWFTLWKIPFTVIPQKKKNHKTETQMKNKSMSSRQKVTKESEGNWWAPILSILAYARKIPRLRQSGWKKWTEFMHNLKNPDASSSMTAAATVSSKTTWLSFNKNQCSRLKNKKRSLRQEKHKNHQAAPSIESHSCWGETKRKKPCLCRKQYARKA